MKRRSAAEVRELFERAVRGRSTPDDALLAVYRAGWADSMTRKKRRKPERREVPTAREQRIIDLGRRHAEAVAARHGLGAGELLSPDKGTADVWEARHELVWLLRSVEKLVWHDAALGAGRFDHTTAMNSYRVVERRIAERPALREELLALVPSGDLAPLRLVGAAA